MRWLVARLPYDARNNPNEMGEVLAKGIGMISFEAIIGIISLVILILNYKKMREPCLYLDVRAPPTHYTKDGRGGLPDRAVVCYKNTANNYLRDLSITYDIYTIDKKITTAELITHLNLGPNSWDQKLIYVYDMLQKEGPLSSNVIYISIEFSYKVLNIIRKGGSLRVKWNPIDLGWPVVATEGPKVYLDFGELVANAKRSWLLWRVR